MTWRTFIRVYGAVVSVDSTADSSGRLVYLEILDETLQKGHKVLGSADVARHSFLE